MTQRTIPVVGMACSACAAHVERCLSGLHGVASASVSLATRTALVEYDEQAITPEEMKEAVNAIGFDLVTEADRSVAEMERREYTLLRRKVLASWVFALLVMAIAMGWVDVGGRDVSNQLALIIAAANLVCCGREIYSHAWKQLLHGTTSMDTLVTLSTAITFAFSVFNTFWGESTWGRLGMTWHTYYDASVMIITFVLTGRLIELHARRNTTDALRQLMGMTPQTARLYRGMTTDASGQRVAHVEEVPIATIERGDVIEVRAGDRIPIDGQVTWADSFMTADGAYVDESMINGEPTPALKQRGSEALAGTIVSQGQLRVKATKTGEATALAHIIHTVEAAQSSKAPVQRSVDRIARVFVPIVAAIALVTFGAWWAAGGRTALPHAILSAVSVLVVACPCALGLATPTALMVGMGKAARRNILVKDAQALERIRQVDAVVIDKTGTLTIPNPNIDFTKADNLTPEDRETLKPHARDAMQELQQMGIDVLLMSGDKEEAVAFWAKQAGITHYHCQARPQDKEQLVRQLQGDGYCVAMVGDGINDSQALALADVSIAMAQGTDVAIDVAQMTLMSDDLRRIPEALRLSRQTISMVRQNLFWAFMYNVLSIPLAAGAAHLAGFDFQITPSWASAMMACSSLSVVLNSLRLKWKD